MKRVIDWLFKPYNCQYEQNWSAQCYNRAWGLLIVVNFILLFALAVLAVKWGEDRERMGTFLSLVAVAVIVFAGNIFQLDMSCRLWPERCEELYEELTHGGSR